MGILALVVCGSHRFGYDNACWLLSTLVTQWLGGFVLGLWDGGGPWLFVTFTWQCGASKRPYLPLKQTHLPWFLMHLALIVRPPISKKSL